MKFTSDTARIAGQKSKRTPNKILQLIKESADKESTLNVFRKLQEKAEAGDLEAIRLYLSYVAGKPTESVDITTGGDQINKSVEVEVIRTYGQVKDSN